MGKNDSGVEPTEPTEPNEPQEGSETEPNEGEIDPNGEGGEGDAGALGDAGKKALDSMKGKWRTERDQRKALETRIAELEAAKSKPEGDEGPDLDAIKRQAHTEATQAANQRILRAEVKAAAAGKLADPSDALRLIDLSAFDVDSDSNIDAEDIADAINGLLQAKPYLSAQGGKRFQGSADNGARKPSREAGQVTKEQLKTMAPEAIAEARKAGRLSDLGYK